MTPDYQNNTHKQMNREDQDNPYFNKKWYDVPFPELLFKSLRNRSQKHMTEAHRTKYYVTLLLVAFVFSTVISLFAKLPQNIISSFLSPPIFSVESIQSEAELFAFVFGFYITLVITFFLISRVDNRRDNQRISWHHPIGVVCTYLISAFIGNSVFCILVISYSPLFELSASAIMSIYVIGMTVLSALMYYALKLISKELFSLCLSLVLLMLIRSSEAFGAVPDFLIYILAYAMTFFLGMFLESVGFFSVMYTGIAKWIYTPRYWVIELKWIIQFNLKLFSFWK